MDDSLQVSTVSVDAAYQGSVHEVMEVSHGTWDSTCGLEIGVGDRVMAFTYSYQGSDLNLDGCGTLVDRAGDDGKAVEAAARRLGPGTDPLPGARSLDKGETVSETSDGLSSWWLAGGAALIVLTFIAWRTRHRLLAPQPASSLRR